MLFKKYSLIIFREREGVTRRIRVHGSLFVIAVLGLIFLGVCTAYMWHLLNQGRFLQEQLNEANKTVQEQNSQIASMAGKLQGLQADLGRVQTFDTKLRVMMNLEKDPQDINIGNAAQPGAVQLPLYRQELLARRVHNLLDQLTSDTRMEEVRQQELLHLVRLNKDVLSSTPSIWPVEGYLSSGFGGRAAPFGGKPDFHKGLDIANSTGTPIRAPAKGVVVSAGWDGAYGNCIIINHGNNLSTRYAHMHELKVKEGQAVSRGDVIGTLGSTGRSTGPHLHYEVRIGGVCVNPMRYILD